MLEPRFELGISEIQVQFKFKQNSMADLITFVFSNQVTSLQLFASFAIHGPFRADNVH
jgi:hypothetical protein